MYLRAISVWVLIIFVESIHGVMREVFLSPLLGDQTARRVSVLTALIFIAIVTLLTIRWIGPNNNLDSLAIGGSWVLLTVAFELILGIAVLDMNLVDVLKEYDLAHGGMMGIGLLVMLVLPLIARRVLKTE